MSFRPIEAEDVRYAWAAYKKAGLKALDETFSDGKMGVEEFKAAFETEILIKYRGAWTLFADTKRGHIPVCFALGFWCHPEPQLAPYMILEKLIWLPWSSARNRVESAVNFFNIIRNQIPMMTFVREPEKKFVEMLMKHGIMRRIGTSHTVVNDAGVYETRT